MLQAEVAAQDVVLTAMRVTPLRLTKMLEVKT